MTIRKLGLYWAVYSGEQAVFTSDFFPQWAADLGAVWLEAF